VRKKYPTDLTDPEWEILRPFIPEAEYFPNLTKPKYERRDIVDGIFYRERTGCQWRNLPHDYPPWKQVFEYYRTWRSKGVIEKLHDALRDLVRSATPYANGTARTAAPTLCILDSQSAKGSEECEEARGFDAGKKVKGRKRHLIVDALGLVLAIHVTSASVQDRDAALPIFSEAKRDFPSLEVAFADGGYRGQVKSLVEKKTKLRVEISLRSDTQKNWIRSTPGSMDC
jgi:transposase